MSLLLGYSGGSIALGATMLNIATLLLLPFGLRTSRAAHCRRLVRAVEAIDERRGPGRHPPAGLQCVQRLQWLEGLWTSHGVGLLGLTLRGRRGASWRWCCGSRGWSRGVVASPTEDEITTVFCGSKKTPGFGRADGKGSVWNAPGARCHRAAADVLPPAAALRVLGARPALRATPGRGPAPRRVDLESCLAAGLQTRLLLARLAVRRRGGECSRHRQLFSRRACRSRSRPLTKRRRRRQTR